MADEQSTSPGNEDATDNFPKIPPVTDNEKEVGNMVGLPSSTIILLCYFCFRLDSYFLNIFLIFQGNS